MVYVVEHAVAVKVSTAMLCDTLLDSFREAFVFSTWRRYQLVNLSNAARC